MGVREALNKNKGVAATVSAVVLCGAVALMIWENTGSGPTRITKAYYTVDEGKTWFVDDANKMAPFDHDGQQAYRADLFKDSSGKKFVGFLERYTDKAKARVAQLRAKPVSEQNPSEIGAIANAGLEVRRPGDTKWVPMTAPQGVAVTNVEGSDGGPVAGVVP